jgi:hypothetical protein
MVRPGGLRRLTLFAPSSVCLDDLVLEDISAGIDRHGPKVRDPEAQQQDVEYHTFGAGQRARVERRLVEEQLGEVAQESDEQADGGDGEALDKGRIADSCHGGGGDGDAVAVMGYIVGSGSAAARIFTSGAAYYYLSYGVPTRRYEVLLLERAEEVAIM